jgi:hypothetical protein
MIASDVLFLFSASALGAPNPACGDATISEVNTLRISSFIHGSDTPLQLSTSFSPTTCTYTAIVPPTVQGLLKVEVVPASIGTWQQPGQLRTLQINGHRVECFQSEGKCNSFSVEKEGEIDIKVEVFNNTKGGPPTWTSEYTVKPNTTASR